MMLSGSAFVIALMASTATAEPAVDPRKDPNKLICRRDAKTGSLVKTTRRCLTRAQWSKLADQGRRDAEEITGRAGANANN